MCHNKNLFSVVSGKKRRNVNGMRRENEEDNWLFHLGGSLNTLMYFMRS